ncbi:hypothetical protein FACS1894109_16970 [Spirochaetia bacterium]|nr:hypothetical protein FACS1894109_16970 [Spirochaetia bacterium]
MYESFSSYTVGSNHVRLNKPCQDFALHVSREGMQFAIVADGHGSEACFRSGRGAQFAAHCAAHCITEFVETLKAREMTLEDIEADHETLLRKLEKSIIAFWHEMVEADYTEEPFTTEELEKAGVEPLAFQSPSHFYGTTLIAVAAVESYWFGLHIGDGKCVAIDRRGICTEPIPWDDTCFLNVTTSLCDNDAAEKFRHYFSRDIPAAVFIGSDGVDDSYPVNNNGKHLSRLYKTIAENFAGSGFAAGQDQLSEFLPILSKKGSGDDVSIAGLIDMDAVQCLFTRSKAWQSA